jgi:hypothetical protein
MFLSIRPLLAAAARLKDGVRGHDATACLHPARTLASLTQEQAVRRPTVGPSGCSPVYGELLAQGQVLQGELAMAAEEEGEEPK